MDKKRYYIAYGSNLNVKQMIFRCPGARVIGTAKLEGYRLMFKGSRSGSYLTVEPAEGQSVDVGVWEVTPEDELRLDRYEGYPNFYYKKELTLPVKGIKSGKIRERRTFVYIMHEDRMFGLPVERYLTTCAEGFRDFGFDTRALVDAVTLSTEVILNESL